MMHTRHRLWVLLAAVALLSIPISLRAQADPDESQPVEAPLVETSAAPVVGTAVPGLVQAEDYDGGGQGVSFHDIDGINQGATYRSDGVDLKLVPDGSTVVGWFESSEWLNYTVSVASEGEYDITIRTGTAYTPARSLIVRLDGAELGRVAVPHISDWDAPLQEVTLSGVELPAGTRILQLTPATLDWIDVDWISIEPAANITEAVVAPVAGLPEETPPPTCSTPLQTLVNATAPGATLQVPACVYRETVKLTRPIVLDGGGQAEIRGTDVWTEWRREDRGWRSVATVPAFNYARRIECIADRCQWPEQVFLDGQPLEQVASTARPETGKFAVDANRRVLLADDPNGHSVEVTVRNRWIDVQSDGVTIQGFRMRGAANEAQLGAIGNQSHSRFVLQDSVLADAHGAVVSLGGGRDLRLLRNDISRGGQEGVSGYQANQTLIQHNRIHHNNTEGFKPEWEAGGLKVVAYTNAVIDGNDVYANHGPGLWCDIACRGITFSNNRVRDNLAGPGIFFEISEGAEITRNTVWNTSGNWPGIFVSSSSGANVRDNLVAWSRVAIAVQLVERADRLPSAGTANQITNNHLLLSRPDGLALEWTQHGSGRLFEPDANNRASANNFWYPSDENGQGRFVWRNRIAKLADFANTPVGRDSHYLSTADRDRLLNARSVPPMP